MGRLKNEKHEAFARLFVFGDPRHDPRDPDGPPDTRHRHREAYRAAGYRPRTDEAARVAGYRLLQREDVQRRIQELRDEAVEIAQARRYRWAQLVPDAQEVLLDAVTGRREVRGPEVQAAKAILENEAGPPSLRFKDPKTGKERTGIPVYVLGAMDDEPDQGDENG